MAENVKKSSLKTFVPRLSAPSRNDGNYYSDKNPFYAAKNEKGERPLMMPNCTAYTYGRLMEITGKTFEGLIGGDARTWFGKAEAAGYETGTVPKLGAVCCFGVTDGGAGHISVVEEIKDNGDITTSNSAYGGSEFFLKTLTKASGYNYAPTRPFKGFIYCGVEFDGGEEESPSDGRVRAGLEIKLKDTSCYKSETDASSYAKRSGKYFLWDDEVKNGRIRITNAADRVGKPGQVTCWVKLADIGLTEGNGEDGIKKGDLYKLNDTAVYDTENGKTIGKRTGMYYVWSSDVVNGRVKMTNSQERVGAEGHVSFWVDKKDLG